MQIDFIDVGLDERELPYSVYGLRNKLTERM